MSHHPLRWQHRFNNYKRAFFLLQEAVFMMDEKPKFTQLEKEGLIQRFEYSMELAWKVMADYLEHEKVVFKPKTPGTVIRTAFESNLISDGQTWMDALDARNKMSHTYDFKRFEKVIADIRSRYLPVMGEFHMDLLRKMIETEK